VDRSITNHQSTQSVFWNDGPMMMADACVQPHPPYYYYRYLRHHQGHYGRVLLFAVVLLCGGILPLPVVDAFAARNHIENNNAARRPRQRQPTTADGGTRSSGGRNSNIIQNKTPPTTVITPQPSAWWIAELQKCRTAQETIERVCRRLPTQHNHQEREGTRTASSPTDTAAASPASLYSLILIRLSRQLLSSSTTVVMAAAVEQQQVPLNIDDVDAIRQMIIGLTRTTTTEPPEGSTPPQSSKTPHDDKSTKQRRSRRTEQWLADCVEGTKAAAIIARFLSIYCSSLFLAQHESDVVDPGTALGLPLREFWRSVLSSSSSSTATKSTTHDDDDLNLVSLLTPPAMTGLKWAMDTFGALHALPGGPPAKRDDLTSHNDIPKDHNDYYDLTPEFRTVYDGLKIPFEVVPKGLDDTLWTTLTVPSLVAEVDFRADTIQTAATGRSVRERRYTAWQGDDGIAAFAYSGKSMARADWTASVRAVRDRLYQTDGRRQYYDGCLVNYYPNGESAMRYHRDPDQGTLWDYDTAVVSIGSPRPFSFRRKRCPSDGGGDNDNGDGPTAPEHQEVEEIHNFVVFHGDVTHMFADCQARFEHTVKKAGVPDSPRISLVFKRSFGCLDGSTE
jgi:alkylated DNA repair dioxygenase AlkB